jgi:hypothetical protein
VDPRQRPLSLEETIRQGKKEGGEGGDGGDEPPKKDDGAEAEGGGLVDRGTRILKDTNDIESYRVLDRFVSDHFDMVGLERKDDGAYVYDMEVVEEEGEELVELTLTGDRGFETTWSEFDLLSEDYRMVDVPSEEE